MSTVGWICAAALGVAACAEPVPQERLQSTSAAIRAAEEVGAAREPNAALHLQLAKEQSERADRLIAGGDRHQAALMLARAEADANLAVALARSSEEQHEAASAQEKVRGLQLQNGGAK
jgi:hypothetical protein